MPHLRRQIRISRILRIAHAYLSVLSVLGPLMHPQSPVLSVSYPQGVKDPRANFEKLQNSGAD